MLVGIIPHKKYNLTVKIGYETKIFEDHGSRRRRPDPSTRRTDSAPKIMVGGSVLSPRDGAIGSSPVRKRGVIQPNNTCQSPRMGAIEACVIINRPAGALAFLERLLSGASRPRPNAHRPSGPHSRRPVLFRPEGPQAFCRGREAPENGPHNRRAPTGRKEVALSLSDAARGYGSVAPAVCDP